MKRRLSWLSRVALLANLTGVLTTLLGAAMLPSVLVAWALRGPDLPGHVAAAVACISIGVVVWLLTRGWSRGIHVGHREGFLIVGVGWSVAGLVGALPYLLYAHLSGACEPGAGAVGLEFCSFTNAFFESASGFTTTGASIIGDGLWGDVPGRTPDGRLGLPHGVLLWRSMTHFIGGMGIIVLGVAILPLLGVGGMQLFKAEVPGPTTDKLAPRVGETARLLWKVYLLFSAVLFVLLAAGGMGAFEAVCHTMATMATGGFSTRAASVAGFQSAYVEWVIVAFMFVAGVNFTLHFAALRGRFGGYWRDPEFKIYGAVCVVCALVVAVALWRSGQTGGVGESTRIAAFQVLSIVTTTGYASHDFELWTYAPVALFVLLALMFCGGMAGSTGGGIKVVRHVLVVKTWWRELFYLSHPHAVRLVRLGARGVSEDVLRATVSFIGVYMALIFVGTAAFAFDGQDLVTAFTCSASTLGNIGPGLGDIGPFDNYAVLSAPSKWLASFLMVLGRLEIYTLLVLLTPTFWRR